MIGMTDPSPAAQRAKWRKYFEQIIIGSDGEVDAAADGAMEAIARRADQAGVIAAGRAAAAEYRANGGRRQPPRPQAETAARMQAHFTQPAQPARPVQTAPANRASTDDGRSGVVTGLQQRQEMVGRAYFQVWNFRLERGDGRGPMPIELRARSIRGQIANGDRLEIPSSTRPMRLRNLTTGATVRARGKPHPFFRRLGLTLFGILFVIVLLFIISRIIQIGV